MLEVTLILGLLVAAFIFLLDLLQRGKWKNKPPGPRGIPVFGNMLQLGKGGTDVIQNWNKSYGDVFALHLGKYRMVVLNGYETIKEAYSMPEFAGRVLLKPFETIAGKEKRGLVLSEGKTWTEQRRFALRNLRDFGFGKKSMESVIQEDINDVIESLKKLEGKPFVPNRMFSTAVVRSLWNIITGERFALGDPRFQSILDAVHTIISGTPVAGPIFFMPWIAKLLPESSGWNTFEKSIGKAKELIKNYIAKHKETFDANNPRDYMDVYLKEINQTNDKDSSFHRDSGAEQNLIVGTLNLLGAGAETTSNTIVWTISYLIKYPQVQEKLFQEISNVIGTSRLPSLDDRNSCPYTLAVMEEILRISSLTPLGVFHNTMTDINFKGYFIPKDTIVAANLFGVHHDKETWKDPEIFRPERFMNGNKFAGNEQRTIIPFSIGKRVCLGETLARNNFFMYLTSLIQKFEFKQGEEGEFNVGVSAGLTRTALPFKIIIKERV